MFHRRSFRPHASPCADARETARRFYCGVLGGRQVWPSERVAGRGLCFQVGHTLLTVRPHGRGVVAPALLVVDDPAVLAARCWDAGFRVRVRELRPGRMTLVVADPFGRPLVLIPRAVSPSHERPQRQESR